MVYGGKIKVYFGNKKAENPREQAILYGFPPFLRLWVKRVRFPLSAAKKPRIYAVLF
jgi:hypothetical protein